MPAAVQVKESFSVQSPSFLYGTTVVAERLESLIVLNDSAHGLVPDIFAELAAQYRRVQPVDDSSGGLPGDRYPF